MLRPHSREIRRHRETRIFTEVINNNLIDLAAQVTTCELFDGLPYDFPGSPASRSYARQDDKT